MNTNQYSTILVGAGKPTCKSHVKYLANSGQWQALGDLFDFTPIFYSGSTRFIDWHCIPGELVAILREKSPPRIKKVKRSAAPEIFGGYTSRWELSEKIETGQIIATTLDGKPFDARRLRHCPKTYNERAGIKSSKRIGREVTNRINTLRQLIVQRKSAGLYCPERESVKQLENSCK